MLMLHHVFFNRLVQHQFDDVVRYDVVTRKAKHVRTSLLFRPTKSYRYSLALDNMSLVAAFSFYW